jgi:hypothetical protein
MVDKIEEARAKHRNNDRISSLDGMRIDVTDIQNTIFLNMTTTMIFLMYIALTVIIAAIISLAIGFSVEQAYGQANMTGAANMTVSSRNMTVTNTSATIAVPTPEVLMQKLNNALDDVLDKVRQQDPDAYISKVECSIDSSWNVQCTISWRPAKGAQVSASNLNSSKSNLY